MKEAAIVFIVAGCLMALIGYLAIGFGVISAATASAIFWIGAVIGLIGLILGGIAIVKH